VRSDLASLLRRRTGHFEYESGHHGDQWLELERLCLEPAALQVFVRELAAILTQTKVEFICGPLVEGALVGLLVAQELEVQFVYAERHVEVEHEGLFPVHYRIPGAVRGELEGKRIAIVNDVINAGSAVQGALNDLATCDVEVVMLASILVVSEAAQALAEEAGVPLASLETEIRPLFEASDCPQCKEGIPLIPHPGT